MCYLWHQRFNFEPEDYNTELDMMFDLQLLVSGYNALRKDIDTVDIGRGSQDASYETWKEFNDVLINQWQEDNEEYGL